ncbi:hypothetical protein CGMCC3_g160 [Colletotrichum fructicola]|uniref:Uncharacterized protein n=1 Tax=Colletotrichum chrysophilum TaxID=1836956 RepID=A0AAD9AW05_9PEZI|nr:uncharacterized protein CGMCC3_g160 [Colletotrichum fructicola]KAE9583657.1 hypothetical protein CGMCC3_g160 [Colletotrichum fructicola]KAK1855501.1 hypothetical protein CCHR01_01825 [Colletotrichum chrysophilum]
MRLIPLAKSGHLRWMDTAASTFGQNVVRPIASCRHDANAPSRIHQDRWDEWFSARLTAWEAGGGTGELGRGSGEYHATKSLSCAVCPVLGYLEEEE